MTENKKDEQGVSMLLAAIASANTYADRDAIKALVNAGMDWAQTSHGSDEEKEAWKAVAKAAGWY